jgi:hypothetical protein
LSRVHLIPDVLDNRIFLKFDSYHRNPMFLSRTLSLGNFVSGFIATSQTIFHTGVNVINSLYNVKKKAVLRVFLVINMNIYLHEQAWRPLDTGVFQFVTILWFTQFCFFHLISFKNMESCLLVYNVKQVCSLFNYIPNFWHFFSKNHISVSEQVLKTWI